MNIASSVETGRALYPHRPALIFEGVTISYLRLDQMAQGECARLRALGVGPGDRVALCLPNTPQFVASYLGALKLGAIVVSVNPALAPAEIDFIRLDSGATVVISDPERWSEEVLPPVQDSEITARTMDHSDPAVIVYTSGTSGFPKGATLSHGNVVFTMESKRRYLGIRSDDRLLLFLPLFHCFGQNAILNAGLCAGASIVLHRCFDPELVLNSITRDAITMLCAVPANFVVLLDAASKEQLQGIRYFLSAAAPLPLELEIRWQEKFGLPIHQGYGLTESSPFASYNHVTAHRPGSIGTPIDGVEMVISDIGNGRLLEPGCIGEILIKGPNVMLGYWNRPTETSEIIHNGWLHTGDVGRMSADGFFYIEDRLKDMAIVGGYNVYPAEVENALYRHSAVAEAAVYGVPDAVLGERVRAAVILKPGAAVTAGELTACCRAFIAEYKVPVDIEFVSSIPKSGAGKVLKRVLRDKYSDAQSKLNLQNRPLLPNPVFNDAGVLERRIVGWIAEHFPPETASIDPDWAFSDFGFTSLGAVGLAIQLNQWLGREVSPTITWQFSSPRALARHLASPVEPIRPKSEPGYLSAVGVKQTFPTEHELALLSEEDAEALLLAELDGMPRLSE